MKDKHQLPIGIGISSILLIFVILCLLTFAVLSLVSANADYKLVKKNSAHTHEVYEAENSANELMDKIDFILKSTYQSSDSSNYLKQVQQNLTSLDGISFPSKDQIAYEVKVNEHQTLQVVLLLNSEIKKGDSFYQIETWKLINTQTWEADDTLPIYTGDN